MITSHDMLEPSKPALMASRGVIISSPICGSKSQRVSHLTQTHLCDTPFCSVSCDTCAIPREHKSTKELRDTIAASITRYKSIAVGPPRYGFRHSTMLRSRPGKPNQRKGQNEKFMNFAHFCEFCCFSLGKQARFTN